MNNRTRNVLAMAAAVLVLAATGCTDTTVEPKSTISDAKMFADAAAYKGFIAKVYAGLAVTGQQGPAGKGDIAGDEGFSHYLRLLWELNELPTDEAVIAWNDAGVQELNTMAWGDSNPFLSQMYYRIYFQVALANEFLRKTTDDQLGGVAQSVRSDIKTYRAEARFLRALSYWHGLDFFGNVPMVTEQLDPGSALPKQATRAEMYDFVVSELNAIKGDLPLNGPSTYGRATKAAAAMLLANVYLNSQVYTGTAHWSEARAAAEEAIASGFALEPRATWRRMFMADNNNSPELIFVVPQDGTHTQTWGGMTFLVHAAIGWNDNMPAGTYGVDGGWGGIRLRRQTFDRFEQGDQRASFFWSTNHSADVTDMWDFRSGIAAPKFVNVTSTGANGARKDFPDTDYPMFRLGEAYLIYAEAVLRGGGGSQATALQYVNALRERAFGDATHDYTAAQLTGTAGLDLILNERGRELLWEGHRRQDLVRFGKFTGGSYIWQWKGGVQPGKSVGDYLALYPIPANELIVNKNLTQNPGY